LRRRQQPTDHGRTEIAFPRPRTRAQEPEPGQARGTRTRGSGPNQRSLGPTRRLDHQSLSCAAPVHLGLDLGPSFLRSWLHSWPLRLPFLSLAEGIRERGLPNNPPVVTHHQTGTGAWARDRLQRHKGAPARRRCGS
jgi:hypothetical protein